MLIILNILVKIFVSIAILYFCGLIFFVKQLPEETANINKKYDVIVVLTGGKERIPYALQLFFDNYADTVFISGVAENFDIAAFDYNLKEEDKKRISYGFKAKNTIGNAEETKEWLKGRGYNNLLIVTANYHTPRTKLLFDYYLKDYQKTYISVNPPDFNLSNWLQHSNSRRLILSEYSKFILTWIKISVL